MTQLIELEEAIGYESVDLCDGLKSLIMESILESTENLESCIVSYAYVAIQKFIAHCKDHNIDPLTVDMEYIQHFVDGSLKKELNHERKRLV